MKINIETKFNIGDAVYVTECYYDFYYASKRRCVINHITVDVTPDVRLTYGVENKDLGTISYYAEHMLFSTYEECQKWCESKNC